MKRKFASVTPEITVTAVIWMEDLFLKKFPANAF